MLRELFYNGPCMVIKLCIKGKPALRALASF